MVDRETTIAVINLAAAVIALAAAGVPIIRILARSARARGKTDVFIALIVEVVALVVFLAAAVAFIGFRSSASAAVLLLLSGLCQVLAFRCSARAARASRGRTVRWWPQLSRSVIRNPVILADMVEYREAPLNHLTRRRNEPRTVLMLLCERHFRLARSLILCLVRPLHAYLYQPSINTNTTLCHYK